MKKTYSMIWVMVLVLLVPALASAAGKTEITWYGQSAYKVKTPSGKILLIDPWIVNPVNNSGKDDLAKIDKVDLMLITHGHSDHVGNAVEIANKTKAKLVAPFGLAMALVQYAGFPKESVSYEAIGNYGGEIVLAGGEVKIAFVPALHDSDLTAPLSAGQPPTQVSAGNPAGFVISIKGGPVLYHTGDTDLFSDMALVKEYGRIDIMLACIGDHFTMGPGRAAQAVKLVDPKMVVPMHYGTFPMLTGTPEQFARELEKAGMAARMKKMKIGETLVW